MVQPAVVQPAAAQPATTPSVSWTEPIKASPKPEAETVLDDAPARGPVDLVTVREVDGRPVVSTVSAADLSSAEKLVDRALADPGVLTVSVASTVRALAADPYRPQQWALDRLAAEQVWARQSGAGLVVAVVDTGVAAHPDLAGVVLNGKDYISGGTGRVDPHGHGTHVAGIIAAVANNGIGIAGLAAELISEVRLPAQRHSGQPSVAERDGLQRARARLAGAVNRITVAEIVTGSTTSRCGGSMCCSMVPPRATLTTWVPRQIASTGTPAPSAQAATARSNPSCSSSTS